MRRSWNALGWARMLTPVLLLLGMSASACLAAQAVDRIRGPIDDGNTVTLQGNIRPEVSHAVPLEAPEQDLPMQHMILTLKADQNQEAALAKLVQEQGDPHSPNYHKFLTPQQYGQQFGASPNDVAKVTGWLRDHGFEVEEVPAARRSIVFSGNAGAVTAAFGTPIHKLIVGGETHYANTEEPTIPAALAGVVGGFVKLNDFHHKPSIQRVRLLSKDSAVAPQFTYGSSHYLAPADYATIYDLNSLYSSQIDGTGQSIAIVARSNISMSDLQTFRSQFGLPANNPTVIIASGSDPGFVQGDGDEATLDVQWSGAIAPKATVKLVIASSTASADGVDLSAQYIVNHNLAPVMSVSFGSCEAGMGSGGVGFYNSLWQQAASQGITVLISSGDSGAAGCYPGNYPSGSGRAVNGLCTSPYDVCVGGTEFAEGSNPGQYWLPGNNASLGSAQSYIPETVWNESGSNGGSGLWAAGGGASIYFTKPSWQTGVGVPADGARDVPDVSLAAAGHDGYIIEEYGNMSVIAGTSAASPSFAGMMALVNQKAGARVGNPNANLYKLATLQAAGGAKVFHDVTTGSNTVPGVTGFAATTGYDQGSGLGSVDAALLVNHWGDTSTTGTLSATVTPGTLSLAAGGSTTFATAITIGGGFNSAVTLAASGAPTGVTVTLSSNSIAAPGTGSVNATVAALATAAAGTYTLTITAAGGNLTAKATTALTITTPSFTLTPSTTTVSLGTGLTAAVPVSINPAGGFNSTVTLAASGLPTGVTAVFSPATLSGSAAGSSTLTFTAAQTAKAGAYIVTITATGGGLTKTATLSVTVATPTFAVTASSSSATLFVGATQTVPLSVAPSGGFNSTVSLTASGLPTGVTAAFSPSSVSGSSTSTSTLTFTAAATAKPGTSTVTITAIGGSITKTATLTLTIPTPTFMLGVSAITETVILGGKASLSVLVTPSNGFNSTVSLTASGLPAGVTAAFSPASLTGSTNGASTLTLAVAETTKAGVYTVTLTAAGGGVTQTAPVTVVVPTPTFTLTSATPSATVAEGGNATVPLLITPSNGFSAAVSLTASGLPSGVTASFSPASLSGSVAGASTLTIAAATTAKPGAYTITITGLGGGITQTTAVTVIVPTPTFAVSSSASTATMTSGAAATIQVSVTPSAGFNSTVTLTAAGLPAGMTASFSPATLTGSAKGTSSLTLTAAQTAKAGAYSVTVTGTGGGVTNSAVVTVTVGAPSFTFTASSAALGISPTGTATTQLTFTPGTGFASAVTLTATGLPAGVTAAFSPGSLAGSAATIDAVTFTAASTAKAGVSSVTITATGGGSTKTAVLSLTVTAPVTITLATNPSTLTVTQNSPGNCGSGVSSNVTNCVIIYTTINGPILSPVSLSVSGLPGGVTASFDSTAANVNGNFLTFAVTASAPLGTSTVTLTATGGGLTRTAAIQLTVVPHPAFILGFPNQFITVKAGGPAVPATLSILSTNPGFNSPISLMVAGTMANISQSFTTSTLTVAAPSTTLNVSASGSASPGSYTIALAGNANGLWQTVLLSVTVTH